ncbi:flagellar FliL protein [Rhizomicrobium palustre]|uniref:Flagellar protein FliL n=1 Tax=Rhizomicrobium palustre TaxID=189966 RepID=A0A846MWX6_9PROT|nr:flagellar basal body-associated FliL family protein [Rhizomicrobium palustre]NIK88044.1 flagellar FliL protein [Rhizomicrobium palustre]
MANTDTADGEGQDGQNPAETEKKGFVKKLLGNKKMLIIVVAALLLLLGGGGAGLYFLVLAPAEKPAKAEEPPPPPPTYFDIPDLIVNIQGADGNPVYLKLSVSLELATAEDKNGVQPLMPRVVDQFQGYLRELRPDDLKGSAGIMRVKEELLRRANVAAAPYHVRDVLLKEMIIQ